MAFVLAATWGKGLGEKATTAWFVTFGLDGSDFCGRALASAVFSASTFVGAAVTSTISVEAAGAPSAR